jgi:hypothetical protein
MTNGSGTVNANVTNIQVICSATYTINVIISGLTRGALVLQNNGVNNLTATSNGTFTFSNTIPMGAAYNVTVLTQPLGQNCTVTYGSGNAAANLNIPVACSANNYTIGGTVSGLTSSGLVLADTFSAGYLTVTSNGVFTLPNTLTFGLQYNVTVLTQPLGQNCTVTNGSGNAAANVTNILVICTAGTYTIGGIVKGLTGPMTLDDGLGHSLVITTNGAFVFNASYPYGGGTYYITASSPTQTCTVANAVGTITANVTNVSVNCENSYTIGGAVSGLTGQGLVLNNGSDYLPVSTNGTFIVSTYVVGGTAYNITVATQPTGQNCTVANGSGTVTTNVTNVQVFCRSQGPG